jgi:sugar lactone lactonase YvrE
VADSCNHRFQLFSIEGELLEIWGRAGKAPGELNFPYDAAVDERGVVYVAEWGNNRLQSFDLHGNFLGIFGRAGAEPGEFGNPWGVVLEPRGTLLIADTLNHRLQRLPRGRLTAPGKAG